ncbi:MAG: hypothetical protein JRN57_03875 [Nitrososphaerota archaeon]|nr:hypothetical protein [Nitrososphaerota archaeon]
MSISRSGLNGKLVYNPDGGLIGEVVDTAFVLGSNDFSLVVRVNHGISIEVGWDKIGAGKDILITKENIDPSTAKQVAAAPAVQPAQESSGSRLRLGIPKILPAGQKKTVCPSCGRDATWIKQYSRWYCESEKKYI